MCVQDNGVGMTEETVKTVLIPRKAGGIGLRNVHERITLTFGDGYGAYLRERAGRGHAGHHPAASLREEGLK